MDIPWIVLFIINYPEFIWRSYEAETFLNFEYQ